MASLLLNSVYSKFIPKYWFEGNGQLLMSPRSESKCVSTRLNFDARARALRITQQRGASASDLNDKSNCTIYYIIDLRVYIIKSKSIMQKKKEKYIYIYI